MVDLGVIDIDFARHTVTGPGPQQGIDEDVEVLAKVIAAFDHIATVTIDPDRKMGLDHLVVVEDTRTMRKVADPECVAMVARPAAADLFVAHAQLATRGSGPPQMPVHRRLGNRASELLFQELVDHVRRSARLLLLQFDGPLQHGLTLLAWLAAIAPLLPPQSGNLLLAEAAHLAAERRQRDPLAAAIGQRHFLLAQVFQKPVTLSWLDFLQQDRGQ